MSLPVDNNKHELRLGKSFQSNSSVAFHSFRYDFKPASIDTTQEAIVKLGDNNQATVTLPHIQGSGATCTVFKGNKRPVAKECVLIIDHDTGTYVLEKINQGVALKKTRLEGSSKPQLAVVPTDGRMASPGTGMNAMRKKIESPDVVESSLSTRMSAEACKVDDMGMSELSSDSEYGEETKESTMIVSDIQLDREDLSAPSYPQSSKFLVDDLELSESGSESD